MSEELTDRLTGRNLNEWLSKEQYLVAKGEFLSSNAPQFLNFFNNCSEFAGFSSDLKEIGSNLIALFFFGVWIAYRRFGFKYPVFLLTYDIGERDDYSGIAFHYEENRYVIRVRFLKQILEIIQ
ncbi:MAG: hypothetical protein NZM26_01950 [Patescibacteria group bacterium]|nr:hypothetical protein [Patescibacteria group bacterium]